MNQESLSPTSPTPTPAEPISAQPAFSPRSFNPFLVLVVIVLLVLGGVGGIFLGKSLNNSQSSVQPTATPVLIQIPTLAPDGMINWKTYTNTQIGFAFKYPKEWTEKGPISKNDNVLVYIHFKNISTEITEELQPYLWVTKENSLPNLELKEQVMNGYVVYVSDDWPSRMGALSYFVKKDEKQYISISITPYDLDNPFSAQDKYIKIFDQILSTFKFLDQNQADETADWKTISGSIFSYANTVYSGYTVSYPSDCLLLSSNATLTCDLSHGKATLIINAGGHGGDNREIRSIKYNEAKVISAGTGNITINEYVQDKTISGTYWINKTDKLTQEPIFGFEFRDIPSPDLAEFEKLFDQILSTFRFISP